MAIHTTTSTVNRTLARLFSSTVPQRVPAFSAAASARTSLLRSTRFRPSSIPVRHFNCSAAIMDKELSNADMTKARDESPSQDGEHPSSHQHSESTEGKHQWKTRPPYSIHKDNENFDVKYEASCHCGRVKYQLSRDAPLDSKLCHCTTCQTQHAAPFQWAAIFHKTDINFSHGHHNLEWYDPSSKSIAHKLPCKVRCNFCHSPIMDEGRNMILLFPSLVKFETEEAKMKFKPKCHMFYGQRVIDIPDGLPKWTGINNSSDLIEDSPPELVEERERERERKRAKRSQEDE